MPQLLPNLELPRCPHCAVDRPNLPQVHSIETNDHAGQRRRIWGIYRCARCGGLVTASATNHGGEVTEVYPNAPKVEDDIPATARAYLEQAINSMHAPAGA